MRTKDQISFLELLNENLSYNPMYSKLFEVVGKELDRQIGEPLSQLARIRSSTHIKRGDYLSVDDDTVGKVAHLRREIIDDKPMDVITIGLTNGVSVTQTRRALHDRSVLVDSARLQGFDYYSDFLSDQDFARIVDYVSAYWSTGSSESPEFIKFIGFIKNMSLELTQLWTIDKGDNATSDDPIISRYDFLEPYDDTMLPVYKPTGKHYPTSHVALTYDASISQTIDQDIIHLFYYLAPIHLVLERITGNIEAEIGYTIRIAGDISMYNSGFLEIL